MFVPRVICGKPTVVRIQDKVILGKMNIVNLPIDVTHEPSEKRQLGAYYTPEKLVDVLTKWSIRSATDYVLEPSFGGCGFLKSAAERLNEFGKSQGHVNLYGCDLDPRAFSHLSNTFGGLVDTSNFTLGDFLAHVPEQSWPKTFDAVIGNPPYVPYQNIPHSSREVAIAKLEDNNIHLDLRSSLWAYFVALGLTYLKKGGRIAWVLPGSFTQANYAEPLRQLLSSRFKRIHAFSIKERLFLYEGTDEQTIVVLGDDYSHSKKAGKQDINLTSCRDVAELIDKVYQWDAGELFSSASCGSPVADSIAVETRSLLDEISSNSACHSLGDVADVRIGLVTGENKFFVIDKTTATSNKLRRSDLIPVLAKFSSASGVQFTKNDQDIDWNEGNRSGLINSDTAPSKNKRIQSYLDSYPKAKIETVATFKKRKLWCKTEDYQTPDAFFPVMHHLGPRIVLNAMGLNCTNTIHRVFFKGPMTSKKTDKMLIAISLLSTFSQISAEIVGRKYGSGVLKHEPREAEKIRILLPEFEDWREIKSTFTNIDKLLRLERYVQARKLADEFLLTKMFGHRTESVCIELDKCLKALRVLRHPERTKKA